MESGAKPAANTHDSDSGQGAATRVRDEAFGAVRCHGAGPALLCLKSRVVSAVPVIPSGSISLDAALGIGGFPRGHITEIYGPAACGKTTLALEAIAEAQRLGGTAAFVDAEHSLDAAYVQRIGIDVGALLVSRPECGEQALDIALSLVASHAVDIVVVDSVAAIVPRQELAGGDGEDDFTRHERLMANALGKLRAACARSGACLIFINQLRRRLEATYGTPETTTGGAPLKLHAAVRLELRPVAAIRENGANVGVRTRARVLKNHLASPARTAEFDILFGLGISREADAFDVALSRQVIAGGAEYRFADQPLGATRREAIAALGRNPAVFDALLEELRHLLELPLALLSREGESGLRRLEAMIAGAR